MLKCKSKNLLIKNILNIYYFLVKWKVNLLLVINNSRNMAPGIIEMGIIVFIKRSGDSYLMRVPEIFLLQNN